MSTIGQEHSAVTLGDRALALLVELRRGAVTWNPELLGAFLIVTPDLVCRIDEVLDREERKDG